MKRKFGHKQREDYVKTAIYKPRRKILSRNQPLQHLVSDFQPTEVWEIKFLLFKSLHLWNFVMAALAKSYRQ
jgi:hypothetical protein